jgi:DNA-binding NtrC family response regulator
MTTRVLFVDDDPDVRAMVADALADEFQLTMVSGGAEALEALEASTYAVVLSDLRMPGLNGIELLAEVCKRWPETVRMVLTSDTDFTVAMEAVNEGYVYRFMNKRSHPRSRPACSTSPTRRDSRSRSGPSCPPRARRRRSGLHPAIHSAMALG